MAEKPILFSGDMVRAILDGRKTQTRRIIKPSCKEADGCAVHYPDAGDVINTFDGFLENPRTGRHHMVKPPCAVGDVLWVRETWMPFDASVEFVEIGYKSSNDIRPSGISPLTFGASMRFKGRPEPEIEGFISDMEDMDASGDKWRPSIHMPRWAARLFLRVKSMRVERVKDISETDARAEGCTLYNENGDAIFRDWSPWFENINPQDIVHRASFGRVWMDCYGEESWISNPWVWVIEFEMISRGDAEARREGGK